MYLCGYTPCIYAAKSNCVGNCVCMYWNLCCLVKLPVPSNNTATHVSSFLVCCAALRSLALVPWCIVGVLYPVSASSLASALLMLLSWHSPGYSYNHKNLLFVHLASPLHFSSAHAFFPHPDSCPCMRMRWWQDIVKAFCGKFLME